MGFGPPYQSWRSLFRGCRSLGVSQGACRRYRSCSHFSCIIHQQEQLLAPWALRLVLWRAFVGGSFLLAVRRFAPCCSAPCHYGEHICIGANLYKGVELSRNRIPPDLYHELLKCGPDHPRNSGLDYRQLCFSNRADADDWRDGPCDLSEGLRHPSDHLVCANGYRSENPETAWCRRAIKARILSNQFALESWSDSVYLLGLNWRRLPKGCTAC